MIKGLLLFFHFPGLFFPGSVNVSQTAPSFAQINNSVLIQVTINKGDLNGAGKFTEVLPSGFNAVAIDDEGAQTSFDSNTIAFSWASLPTDGVLNISFRVDITASAALQNYALTGKFSYVLNNQNLEADCAPSNITITNTPVAQGSGTPQPSTPPAATQSSTPQTTIPASTPMAQGNSSPQAGAPSNSSSPQGGTPQAGNTNSTGGVFVVRQFSPTTITPKTDSKVTLTIHKGNINGFAKIEDSIPPGFVAKPGDLNGASFTFVDNRAKFVWGNLPSDSVITASYRLSASSNVPGTHIVVGNFSYIYNDNPLSVSIGSSIFNSSVIPGYDYTAEKNAPPPPPPANNTTVAQQNIPTPPPANTVVAQNTPPPANTAVQNTPPPTTPVTTTPVNTTVASNNQPPVQASTNVASQPEAAQPTSSTPTPTSSVTFRVQILALRNPINISSYLAGKKIKGHVNTEQDGGFTKYTIGNYTDYKSVKDAKEDLRNKGLDGAFIVCYNSGVRISLQEALKITHQ